MMKLKDVLSRAKLTQTALAEKMGCSQPSISKWRNGIPLKRVPKLAKVTGIPVNELAPEFYEKAA